LLGILGAAVTQAENYLGKIIIEKNAQDFKLTWFIFYFSIICLAGGVLAILIPVSIFENEYIGAFAIGLASKDICEKLRKLANGVQIYEKARTWIAISKLPRDKEPDDKNIRELWKSCLPKKTTQHSMKCKLKFGEYLQLMHVDDKNLKQHLKD
jgi:hypothetical protein